MLKPIIFSNHASMQMARRGALPKEIRGAISTILWKKADQNRFECTQNFDYDRNWNGKHYLVKQVRPIFVEESAQIVVVTVYVYYF